MSVIAPVPTRSAVHRVARRRHPWRWLAVLLVTAVLLAVAAYAVVRYLHDDSRRHYLGADGWPARGQASYVVGSGRAASSPHQGAVPIASIAKVMTAYLVLRAAPLRPDGQGFTLTVTAADVADTAMRRARQESTVRLAEGEKLTERDALAAVLLPSANNVAVMLARHVSGSVRAFVASMNVTARRLGMSHTTYTDPSGYSATTTSTADDQLTLATRAMRDPAFAALVRMPSYSLPVAGTVRNTDMLLGQQGFVGIKTGSMDASGGCFVFRTVRVVEGRTETITGVVLGQPGHNLIKSGQYAAAQFVQRIRSADPPLPQG